MILVAWATVLEDQIVCIEEPEAHLHPILQRKLIRYLQESTSNQYLIATHSAHILDCPGASIFHIRLVDGESSVTGTLSPTHRVELCSDLGYRASDLVQANAVIWVEGPSDRLYIRHWIGEVDPELVEGVHYSLMFFGGRLLSHLSPDDPEVSDFICLPRINQWLSVVVDSDRADVQAPVNQTKERVRAAFEGSTRGIFWLTAGREIENYVPGPTLHEAIAAVHAGGSPTFPASFGRYDQVTRFRGRDGLERSIDKVKVAHHVTSTKPQLVGLDLHQKVSDLSRFVRKANGLPITNLKTD